jgi:tetratricopeptide (TPR) repeat protein
VLAPLDPAGPPSAADALELLRPDLSPVPFQGRERDLASLTGWLTHGRYPCYVLGGPPGAGKTRLALEAARRAPEGWVAGWLRPGAGAAACAAVRDGGPPTLILVDDADLRADLFPLLDQVHEAWRWEYVAGWAPAISALVVTRSAQALAERIQARFRRDLTGRGRDHLLRWAQLTPDGDPASSDQAFRDAVGAFAAVLGTPAPETPGRPVAPRPDGSAEPFGMTAARALLFALDAARGGAAPRPERDPRTIPPARLAAGLIRHEQDRWSAATEWDWGGCDPPSRALTDRVMAALTLLGADSEATAEKVLQLVPMPRDAPAGQRRAIASWTASLYPPEARIGISPHLAAEWLIVRQLAGSPILARSLRAELTDEQRTRALGLLGRAAGRVRGAARLFAEFAAGDAASVVTAASRAVLADDDGRLDALVAGGIRSSRGREPDGWDPVQLAGVGAVTTEALPRTRAAIAEARVARCRVLAAGSAVHWFCLAEALRKLGEALTALGQPGRAQEAGREAEALKRAIFRAPPGFPEQLRYLSLSRPQEPAAAGVLRAARRIEGVWSGQCQGFLAQLVPELQAEGLHDSAVLAAREVVTADRADMAAFPPDAGTPSLALARSLSQLGDALARADRHPEALRTTREAVACWQAQGGGQVREPCDLGYPEALLALSGQLGQAGHAGEARAARDRALRVIRESLARGGAYHGGRDRGLLAGVFDTSGERDRPARLLAELAYEAVAVDDAVAGGRLATDRGVRRPDGRLNTRVLLAEFAAFWRQHGEVPDKDGFHRAASPDRVLMTLIERVMDGAGSLSLQQQQVRRRRRPRRWYEWVEVTLRDRYQDAAGALAARQTAIQVMTVPPSSRPRDYRAVLAVGLAAIDRGPVRNFLESGIVLIVDRRPQPDRAVPDPRFSQARTPDGHDVTVLAC